LFGALETFLGLDQVEMDSRAAEYDRQMGIGRASRRRGSTPSEPSSYSDRRKNPQRPERRKGYAYPYEDDDGTPPVAVVEASAVNESDTSPTIERTEPSSISTDTEMSWEERALAVERVPPAGIPAWGPTGDLGVDSRTKAILDALEDIHIAKARVNERRSAVEKAKEDVAILRVDAELEKKRLRSSTQETRVIQSKIRKIDFEIQGAARALRYAQDRLLRAQDGLAALERRHWAVLSFYNPLQVEEAVKDAIREFEESEPAARLYREKSNASDEGAEERGSGFPDESHSQ
jgi:hypothetical protein